METKKRLSLNALLSAVAKLLVDRPELVAVLFALAVIGIVMWRLPDGASDGVRVVAVVAAFLLAIIVLKYPRNRDPPPDG